MVRGVKWGCVKRSLAAIRTTRGDVGQWECKYPVHYPGHCHSVSTVRSCSHTMQWDTAGFLSRLANSTIPAMDRSRRLSSTSMDMQVQAAQPIVRRIPVTVGALLKIDLFGTDVGVNVSVGDSLEEIVLEVHKKAGIADGDWTFLNISTAQNIVWVRKLAASTEGPIAVRTVIPARWCSLAVEAGHCPVQIQSLREGSLSVKTLGGDITLGELKGSTACIDSNGGSFTAQAVSADSVVRTGGGDVSIGKLVGTSIDLETGGGDIRIGSLYSNDVRLASSGGSVGAKHIQAEHLALVSTEGGNVNVSGFDGKARFLTKGGSVDIQLHEHAREVEIDSGEGNVTLYFSNQLTAEVEYHGAQNFEEEIPNLCSTDEPGLFSFVGQESTDRVEAIESRATRSEDAIEASGEIPFTCKVRIVSVGTVNITKRSWLDVATGFTVPTFEK